MFDKEQVEIGCSPSEEECVQVDPNDVDYIKWNKVECRALINQLRRQFPDLCDKVRLKIKPNYHDFGVYYEVNAVASANNEEAVEAAWELQDLLPEKWDEEALDELEREEHPFHFVKIISMKSA